MSQMEYNAWLDQFSKATPLQVVASLEIWLKDACNQHSSSEAEFRDHIRVIQDKLAEVKNDLNERPVFSAEELEKHKLIIDKMIDGAQNNINSNQDLNERWSLGLSGAGILLTLGRLDVSQLNLPHFAWFLFLLAIGSSITSGFVGELSSRTYLESLEKTRSRLLEANILKFPSSTDPKWIIRLNTFSATATFMGMFLLVTYGIIKCFL